MRIEHTGEVESEDEPYVPNNVEYIPCMKTSFLTGISSGLGVGLAHFLFTSKVQRSYNLSLCTYLVVTLGRYFQCRWQRSVQQFEARKMEEAIHVMNRLRGTAEDPSQHTDTQNDDNQL